MNAQENLTVRLLKAGPVNSTIFILGSTGSGKTTLIANLLLKEPRFLIIDTRDDYYPDFFGSGCVDVDRVSQLANALNEGYARIIFKLPAFDESADSKLENVLATIYEFQTLNSANLPPVTVSLDELNRFVETANCPHALREMVQRGRDFNIKKIFGAQWFGTIPTWVRDSFSEIYCFRHTDKSGLNRLADYGFEPDALRNLPQHTCLHAGKNGVETLRLIPDSGNVPRQNKNAVQENG